MASAGDHAIGFAGFHHHHAEIQDVVKLGARLFNGHALVLASLEQLLREKFTLGVGCDVDDLGAFQVVWAFKDLLLVT